MKQKIYLAGVIDLMVILTGTIFKINHYPGAGILLTAGIASFVLVISPLALVSSYRRDSAGQSKALYVITGITCFVVFTAMLFKIQHWPFAGLAMTIALPFPYVIFLPVFIIITSKNKNFSVYNTIFVVSLMVLSSLMNGLLSVSVAKIKIEDSYNLPRSMNNVNMSLTGQQQPGSPATLVLKIDEVLGIINEYQEIILQNEGISEKIWNNHPEYLGRPDSRNSVRMALQDKSDMANGSKLQKAMNDLLETAKVTPGCGKLADALPEILELKNPNYDSYNGTVFFTGDYLAWALTYLAGIETNLRLIKASL